MFFEEGLEVDQAIKATTENIQPQVNTKGIRSFLRNTWFYRRFMNDYYEIIKPL